MGDIARESLPRIGEMNLPGESCTGSPSACRAGRRPRSMSSSPNGASLPGLRN